MFKNEINVQMKKWQVKNTNQLSKLAGIDYRTAKKAVKTDDYVSPIAIAKIAKVFGFTGFVDFRSFIVNKEVKS
tara:strand:- start:81 stop:302 length:222 start_codon:yes stop_codon:yes gene_type:complete